MTKYTVRLYRNLSSEVEIEASSPEEAQEQVDELQANMQSVDYADSEEENDVAPTYEEECEGCHNAETFATLLWCITCATLYHQEALAAYIIEANERMKVEVNRCERCFSRHFNCTYRFGLFPGKKEAAWFIACPRCSEKIEQAPLLSQGAKERPEL